MFVVSLSLKFKKSLHRNNDLVLAISSGTLIDLWRLDPAFLSSITSDGRYQRAEEINAKFQAHVDIGEPLEIPSVNFSDRGKISYNNGRHLTRFLIDSLGITEIPVQLYFQDAERLLAAEGVRRLTPAEEKQIDVYSNPDAIRIFHAICDIVRYEKYDQGKQIMPVTPARIEEELESYFRQRPFMEALISSASMNEFIRSIGQSGEDVVQGRQVTFRPRF